jgi:hypothetical protein
MPNHHYWGGGEVGTGGLIMAVAVRVTRIFEKNPLMFQKVAQKVSKPQNGKISTVKLHFKVQNMYIQPLLKP